MYIVKTTRECLSKSAVKPIRRKPTLLGLSSRRIPKHISPRDLTVSTDMKEEKPTLQNTNALTNYSTVAASSQALSIIPVPFSLPIFSEISKRSKPTASGTKSKTGRCLILPAAPQPLPSFYFLMPPPSYPQVQSIYPQIITQGQQQPHQYTSPLFISGFYAPIQNRLPIAFPVGVYLVIT